MSTHTEGADQFLTDRESIMHGSAYERERMRMYDEPVEIMENVRFLASREPNGYDEIIFDKPISIPNGQNAQDVLNRIVRPYASADRHLGFTVEVRPDEELQDKVSRNYNAQRPDIRLEPENVLTGKRGSFYKAEQSWTHSDNKYYGPFDVYTIEANGKDLAVAIPRITRLSPLELAIHRTGPLKGHFNDGFGIDAMLNGDRRALLRKHRTTGEQYVTTQIRGIVDPELEVRNGRTFTTQPLTYPLGDVTAVKRKTS